MSQFGEAMVELGGRERKIRYDMRAVIKLEEMRGNIPIQVLLSPDNADKVGMGVVCDMLYCGLLFANKRLNRSEVMDWMDMKKVEHYCIAFGKAMQEFQGLSDEDIERMQAEEEAGENPSLDPPGKQPEPEPEPEPLSNGTGES